MKTIVKSTLVAALLVVGSAVLIKGIEASKDKKERIGKQRWNQ
jgi:hypothetical protein